MLPNWKGEEISSSRNRKWTICKRSQKCAASKLQSCRLLGCFGEMRTRPGARWDKWANITSLATNLSLKMSQWQMTTSPFILLCLPLCSHPCHDTVLQPQSDSNNQVEDFGFMHKLSPSPRSELQHADQAWKPASETIVVGLESFYTANV